MPTIKFRFEEVFYFRPKGEPLVTVKFDPDPEGQSVTAECAEQAKAAGVGEVVGQPFPDFEEDDVSGEA